MMSTFEELTFTDYMFEDIPISSHIAKTDPLEIGKNSICRFSFNKHKKKKKSAFGV